MAVINPGGYFQNLSTHTAQSDRLNLAISSKSQGESLFFGNLSGRGGIRMHNALSGRVRAVTPTPNLNVTVDPFVVVVPGLRANTQFNYVFVNDATVTLPVTAGGASTRIDLVCARTQDAVYAGALNQHDVYIKQGTPGAGEPAPDLDTETLAIITVPPSASSITDAMITDRRHWLTSAGGITVPRSHELGHGGVGFGDMRYWKGFLQCWNPPTQTWRYIQTYYEFQSFSSPLASGVSAGPTSIQTLAITDPGFSYYVAMQGGCVARYNGASEALSHVLQLRDGGSGGTVLVEVQAFELVSGSQTPWLHGVTPLIRVGPYVGNKTFHLTLQRVIGASQSISVGGTSSTQSPSWIKSIVTAQGPDVGDSAYANVFPA